MGKFNAVARGEVAIQNPAKVNPKKKKRLEKFIEKQLKKEERIKIIEKLSSNAFSNPELLVSSKSLGKKSLKEQLRLNLMMERAGLSLNNDLLYRKVELLEYNEPVTPIDVFKLDPPRTMEIEQLDDTTITLAAPESLQEPIAIENENSSNSQSVLLNTLPAFGSSLKRVTTNDEANFKRKKSRTQRPTSERGKESDTDDSEEDEIELEKGLEIPNQEQPKSLKWASDVVDGETSFQPTKAPNSIIKPRPVIKLGNGIAPAFYVPVNRPSHLQAARLTLPVVGEEQPIMEAIAANDVIILCGDTGSGKTTQIPQFLYEAGFGDKEHPLYKGMIGITQPRRVAAIGMALRVSDEMNLKDGTVAYQVRYDTDISSKTRIKFMTDGILLRELSSASTAQALMLSQYSCLIIDEAHERTVGTDVLVGWLSRIVKLRNSGKVKDAFPLKLIIMSATLRVEDFTSNRLLYPDPPPVVKVEGRQFKVTVHFNKKTPVGDYLDDVYKKIVKIHTRLPPGGILVFLTGQLEINQLVSRLNKEFGGKDVKSLAKLNPAPDTDDEDDFWNADDNGDEEFGRDFIDKDFDSGSESEEDIDTAYALDGDSDEDADNTQKIDCLHVLPLHSMLPSATQMRIFEPPPPNTRLCVIATNIAETSLTIPGIKYVVDCGKSKEVGWTSKASSDQRAGRAGRISAGHCYRIFSSAVFNDYFEKFQRPEILRIPIEGVILQMKSMGINQIINFPFPTSPGITRLQEAEQLLIHIGALESDGRITSLGTLMAAFPVNPRLAKMLIVAASHSDAEDLLPYVIVLVAALTAGDPFIRDSVLQDNANDEQADDDVKEMRGNFHRVMQLFSGDPAKSDSIRLLNATGAYLHALSRSKKEAIAFCASNFIRVKAMEEMSKLRSQLISITKKTLTDANIYCSVMDLSMHAPLRPPNSKSLSLLQQVIFAGYPDHLAKLDEEVTSRIPSYGGKHALPAYQSLWSKPNEILRIHPSSSLFRTRPPPKWIIYENIIRKEQRLSADNSITAKNDGSLLSLLGTESTNSRKETVIEKLWLKGITVTRDQWIARLAPRSLLAAGKTLGMPEPQYVS